MPKYKDLTGLRYGKLTVVKRAKDYYTPKHKKQIQWLCLCDCGNKTIVRGEHLRSGHTQSCGCYQKIQASVSNIQYNIYDISGDYGIGYTNKGEKFYFDIDDYKIIKDHCWLKREDGYIISYNKGCNDNKKMIRMHRLIMGVTNNPSVFIDHTNHCRNDNRKQNLRLVTPSQNHMNVKYTGVSFDNRINKWYARIGVNNKSIYLGCFKSLDDAISARKRAEHKYYGKYSYDVSLNICERINEDDNITP